MFCPNCAADNRWFEVLSVVWGQRQPGAAGTDRATVDVGSPAEGAKVNRQPGIEKRPSSFFSGIGLFVAAFAVLSFAPVGGSGGSGC
jgi:hypothetical protein